MDDTKLSRLPDEMFNIIKSACSRLGPRLGCLSLPGRHVIETPHYLGNTSRGVVPHLTQDSFARDTAINGVYVGLEDFIERAPHQTPPLYKFKPLDASSPFRRFIALPDRTLCVVGARRTPPVATPAANPNTDESVSVCTAVGFRALDADDYAEAVEQLQVDIIVGLGDIPYGRTLGSKRVERATDRMITWMQDHIALRKHRKEAGFGQSHARLFAPLLPVSSANQQAYIDCLTEELKEDVSGLAFYDLRTLEDLPKPLQDLPRLGFTTPETPHDVLRHIALGIDIHIIPFITSASDAGTALDFTFPASVTDADRGEPKPLGIDMWSPTHSTDLSALVAECTCYACANHHRAYLNHLLNAKEMLAWVLLQLHNHYIIDLFFAGIRKAIADDAFDNEVERFTKVYESTLPEKTGQGPRVRGYHFKSGANQVKPNKAPYQGANLGRDFLPQPSEEVSAQSTPGNGDVAVKENEDLARMLDEGREVLYESALPPADADAGDLQEQGFAEKAQ